MNALNISKPIVLVAEDDSDDRLLMTVAFSGESKRCDLRFVEDGEALMAYLLHSNTDRSSLNPKPTLILLDLYMPKKDGWQALAEINGNANLKDIPVVVWTSSIEAHCRIPCLQAGASDYITKPSAFPEMEAAIKKIVKRWL